jgi:predicted esterase
VSNPSEGPPAEGAGAGSGSGDGGARLAASGTVVIGARPFVVEPGWRLHLPAGPPPASGWPLIVALHGWGMNADYFARLCRGLLSPDVAVLFPEAPWAFEMRGGSKIRIGHAWYLFTGDDEPFRSTLARAEAHLNGVLDDVVAGRGSPGGTGPPLDPSRIALFGFSQGAYAGYFVAIRNSRRFMAMAGLGGGRMRPEFLAEFTGGARRIPFLVLHGAEDTSVDPTRARDMVTWLGEQGFPAEFREIAGKHEVTPEGVVAAAAWLRAQLDSGRGA